jgi:hypothetical protein
LDSNRTAPKSSLEPQVSKSLIRREKTSFSSPLKLVVFRHPWAGWKQMLDPSQSLSTLDQDLDGVLVESVLVVNPDPKDLMAVQNRD